MAFLSSDQQLLSYVLSFGAEKDIIHCISNAIESCEQEK